MGLLKVPALTDYWRKGRLYSLPFPQSVLSGRKFFSIVHGLHLSSPDEDAKNESKRGTADFYRLGKIKPIYIDIRNACCQNFQPNQHISIDERMVASKALVIFKQYLKNKPVRWGYKLFVLADSQTGYMWDFFVYEGKSAQACKKGLSYDLVMTLVNTSLLGTGYKLFVDNFNTSPVLFQDLLQKNITACGTIRTNGQSYPKTTVNILDTKATRGSIRWIRKDPLLFVQWRDTRDVFMCSTMHTAHGEETVTRRVKDEAGRWTKIDVPIPPAIKD
ncbi:piggyBac transposable element-derived protein 4-like [Polypterus senegalus]|uniref:piggyBac transposable element-derived protein 4-like n=1 Tax=Polypterus senegalus TaxID=55291 RepID=UPI001963B18E|nr:piggyBac transposable element-derived protein 4-like [Polypterus senegalus]